MNDKKDIFPLSNNRNVKGTRRLAREKVLQILMAYNSCETDLDELFEHIYFREFNFGDEVNDLESGKFFRPEEILEMESDIPVIWKDEDVEFGRELAKTVVSKQLFLDDLLEEFAKNWEIDRIAKIDKFLVQLAICELIFFEQIPPKVSINEAIEISKRYSTDKSKMFVNGILDSILKKLENDGMIKKSGRGLQS